MIDTVSIDKKTYAEIMMHLKNAYPYEGCGILLGNKFNKAVESIRSIDNSAGEGKTSNYLIDPIELYKLEEEAESMGMEIIGFYHSHPDKAAILSRKDEQNMIPGLLYMVESISRDGIGEIKGYIKDELDEKIYIASIREA